MDDLTRHIIERAVSSGRARLSPQTGYIHYHPHVLEGEPAQAIPLYENFLYCLALFRTKTQENIQEAKGLLERLSFFQQRDQKLENFGAFPLYLHEYPYCKDYLKAIKCFFPLYWIYKDFHHVVSEHTRAVLKEILVSLVVFYENIHREVQLPFWAKMKIAAAFAGVAALFHDDRYRTQSKQLLISLDSAKDARTWFDPDTIAEMLSCYHILKDFTDASYWEPLWRHLAVCYSTQSMNYIGPSIHIEQELKLPKTTLLDYYMWAFTGVHCKEKEHGRISTLEGALVYPDNACKTAQLPKYAEGISDQYSWWVHEENNWSCSCVVGNVEPHYSFGFFPIYITSGLHTLCMQPHKGVVENIQFDKNTVKLTLSYDGEIFKEEKDKNKILSMWFDDSPNNRVLVMQEKATTFEIEDQLHISLGKTSIGITSQIIEGSARLMGHISRANRSGQILDKGQDRYTAYDVQCILRAIRGSSPIKLVLQFEMHD